MIVDNRKGTESELQPKATHSPKSSTKESEPPIVEIQDLIAGCFNRVRRHLKPIEALCEILENVRDLQRGDTNEADLVELGITQNVLNLIADGARRLGEKAEESSADVKDVSKAILLKLEHSQEAAPDSNQ